MAQAPDHRSVNQVLLACDDHGRFTGQYVRRDVAHTGDGRRHLAIAVLLYDARGELLLQRRRHALFDDVWDITGATHPLRLADGTDEPLEQAALRCLRDEYGLDQTVLTEVGAFTYFAKDPGGFLCENEHCTLYVGACDGPVQLNHEVGYECAWVSKSFLLEDMAASPDNYAPWARLSVDLLRRAGFFH